MVLRLGLDVQRTHSQSMISVTVRTVAAPRTMVIILFLFLKAKFQRQDFQFLIL